jgi:hypothetical protein
MHSITTLSICSACMKMFDTWGLDQIGWFSW